MGVPVAAVTTRNALPLPRPGIVAGLVAVVVVLALSGCAGSPSAYDRDLPNWVLEPPRSDDEYEYFVAAGSSPAGDAAEAEDRASAAMIDEIVRYLGVRVTSETTATARASLEQFETDVEQQITQRADARLSGFRVTDRFRSERGEVVTVYLLGSYEHAALNAERERLQALFQEREDAIAEPEQRARRLEREGRSYEAVGSYLEAARAAAGSQLENAEIRAERNLNEARRLLAAMRLDKHADELETEVRTPFEEPFELQVTVDGRPVPGARVRISYQDARADGRPGMRSVVMSADDEGVLRFRHPTPRVVGSAGVTMTLDLEPVLGPLTELPDRYRPQLDAIRRTAVESQTVFRYRVVSRAHNVPTAVAFLDTDLVGNATGRGATRSGIVDALSRSEFRVQAIALESGLLQDENHRGLLEQLRDEHGDDFERLVVGRAGIDEVTEDNGAIVRVSGSVTVLEVETGEVLYSTAVSQRSRANSPEGAVSAAFRALGDRIGEQLAATLP